MSEIFAHAVGKVDLVGGMIRVEMVALVPRDGRPPVPEPRAVLILPLQGFLESSATFNDMIRRLADEGMIKRAEPKPPQTLQVSLSPVPPKPREPDPPPPPPRPASPNFA